MDVVVIDPRAPPWNGRLRLGRLQPNRSISNGEFLSASVPRRGVMKRYRRRWDV